MTEKKPTKGKPFTKGVSGNPAGRKSVYHDYNARALFLLDKFSVETVLGIVRCINLPKEKALVTNEMKAYHHAGMKMSSRDLTILMSIAHAFTTGGALPFTSLLDRAIGKPAQTVNLNQSVVVTSDDERRKAAQDQAELLLNRIASRRQQVKPKPKVH